MFEPYPTEPVSGMTILSRTNGATIGRTDEGVHILATDNGPDSWDRICGELTRLGATGPMRQVCWWSDGAELWLIAAE